MTLPKWLKQLNPVSLFSRFVTFTMPQFIASWMKADTASFISKGYSSNVYVFSAVNQITTKCASIPWRVYRIREQKAFKRYKAVQAEPLMRRSALVRKLKEQSLEADDSHPLNKLLMKPNKNQSWTQFVECVEAFKNITGEAFVFGARAETGDRKGRILEMMPMPSQHVTILQPEWPLEVAGYRYKNSEPENPANVLHLKYFNPLDPRIGMSPLVAAVRPVTQSNSYFEWNTALVQNMGRIPGIIQAKVTKIDEKQRDQLREQWMASQAGAQNAGMPFIIGGEFDWKDTAFKPHDLDWIEGFKLTASQIAMAYQIPPELLGDSEHKTYNSTPEAIRYFYFGKIIPEMDAFRDELNKWLLPAYETQPNQLWLDYSIDEIEILQEEWTAVHTRALQAFQAGAITLNQFLYETGRSEIGAEGDVRLIPMGYTPWDPADLGGQPTEGDILKMIDWPDAVQDYGGGNGH